jgi:hypothetical protein
VQYEYSMSTVVYLSIPNVRRLRECSTTHRRLFITICSFDLPDLPGQPGSVGSANSSAPSLPFGVPASFASPEGCAGSPMAVR